MHQLRSMSPSSAGTRGRVCLTHFLAQQIDAKVVSYPLETRFRLSTKQCPLVKEASLAQLDSEVDVQPSYPG